MIGNVTWARSFFARAYPGLWVARYEFELCREVPTSHI